MNPIENFTAKIAFINDKSPIIDIIAKDLVASGIDVLSHSENLEDAILQLSVLKEFPEACIIDLDFYDKNVLVQLQKLKAQYPHIRLIAHSDIIDESVAKTLLEIGFESYLLVGSDADDFKKAIDKAVNG